MSAEPVKLEKLEQVGIFYANSHLKRENAEFLKKFNRKFSPKQLVQTNHQLFKR